MMSASSSRPDVSSRPRSVKRSMWSVTTDDVPARMDLKRSPLGVAQNRWSHGSYCGVKCVAMS